MNRQLVRHARILGVMMKTGADAERVGDSFVQLAERPDFLRGCVAHRDPALERRLWQAAVDRRLVAPEAAGGPIPMSLFAPTGLVHGTLPSTGLTPVIFCWFGEEQVGLFVAADVVRGNDYHRLTAWRPPRGERAPRRRLRALSSVASVWP